MDVKPSARGRQTAKAHNGTRRGAPESGNACRVVDSSIRFPATYVALGQQRRTPRCELDAPAVPYTGTGHREMRMRERSPFEDGVYLKGNLIVRVTGRSDGLPQVGRQVAVRACGFV
jgi:hypothetical protein